MFCVLAEPLVVDGNSIWRKYKNGATLFYQRSVLNPGFLNVFAEADYGEAVDYTNCVYMIMNEEGIQYEPGVSFEVMEIAPVKKTEIDAHGKFVLERHNFFLDMTGAILKEFVRYKHVFDVDEEAVNLYYSLSDDRRCVTYYGSSCENYSVKRLKNRTKHDVICSTYRDFLEQKRLEEKAEAKLDHSDFAASTERKDGRRRRRHSYPWEETEESILRGTIRLWKQSVHFREFYEYMSERVKGQKELSKVVAGVYTYLSCIADGRPIDSNMLLAAPSGCGKTETFRALRDYFAVEIPELPVYQIDMTSITEEGFKGANTKEIVLPLCRCRQPEGIGIVFLDEFDKKLVPSYTSGGNNVNAAVQAQILTLLEGRRIQPNPEMPEIDTSNTMFVGLGSFDVCRKERTIDTHPLGFGALEEGCPEHYDAIAREEMLSLGASYELLGRFASIVNYYKLPDYIVNQIIDRNVERISQNIGCRIEITQEKREELLKQANGKFGCRILYNDLHDQALVSYTELLMEDAELSDTKIILDADGRTKLVVAECEIC